MTRRLGALERRGLAFENETERFRRSAVGDGLGLFALRDFEVKAVVQRFQELGLSDLLEPPLQGNDEELEPPLKSGIEDFRSSLERLPTSFWEWAKKQSHGEKRVCDAIGAKAACIETFGDEAPPFWREFGKNEAEAWFLVNFASFYSRMNAPYEQRVEEKS